MAMFPDFALSDISNLFMPLSADEDSPGEIGKLVVYLYQGGCVFVSVLVVLKQKFLWVGYLCYFHDAQPRVSKH